MIQLDYRPSSTWYSVAAPKIDFANLTEFGLEGEAFDGEAIIVVDGVDLSCMSTCRC
jgi:hypothetical protein